VAIKRIATLKKFLTLRSVFYLVCILIGVVGLRQTFLTLNDYARLWHRAFWRMRADTSFSRSAVFYMPDEVDFLRFVASVVPSHGAVVVVPEEVRGFSSQNIMQFFLLDRAIMACGDEGQQAIDCLKVEYHFIPAINDFPPQEAVEGKRFIPYQSGEGKFKGIYVPADYVQPPPTPEPFYNPFLTLLLDTLILGALFILGYLAVCVILGRTNTISALMLSFPFGMGLYSWVLFVWSWAGGRLELPTVVLVYLVLSGLLFMIRWIQTGSNPLSKDLIKGSFSISPRNWRLNPIEVIALGGIGLLFLVAVIISVGKGYSLFDDMAIWSLKGYYIGEKGTIFAAQEASGHGLSYPLNISLIVTVFWLISGDLLPGSKFLFPLLTGSLLLGCFWFWKKRGTPRVIAILGVLLLLSVPETFKYTTFGFANMPFTVYLVLGTLWSIEGLLQNDLRVLLTGGVLLTLAGWTRPEGLGFAYAMALTLLLFVSFWRAKLHQYFFWLLSVGSLSGIWLSFGAQYMGKDQIGRTLRALMAAWQANEIDFESLNMMRDHAIWWFSTPSYWGWIVPVTLLLLVFALPMAILKKDFLGLVLLAVTLIAALVPAFLFFTESVSDSNFAMFLSVSFNRAYFPAVFFLTLLAVHLTRNLQETVPVQSNNE
jgi:hypothetical protein